MQVYKNLLHSLRISADLFMLMLAFIVGVYFSPVHHGKDINVYESMLFISTLFLWVFASKSTGLYDEFRSRNFGYEIIAILKNTMIVAISVIVIVFVFKQIQLARIFLSVFIITSIALITVERYIFRQALTAIRKRGRNLRSILIVGAGKVGWSFYETVKMNPQFGYRFIGFLDDKKHHYLNGEYLGPIDDLEKILESKHVDNVIVALPNYASSKLEEVMTICDNHTTRIKIIPDYFDIYAGKYHASMFGNFPILSLGDDRLNEAHWSFLKRVFDIAYSGFLFISVFSWLWLIIGVLIKLSSPGPVFFKQERWGRNNKRFTTYKFRTMCVQSKDTDDSGNYQQATKGDPRITSIGKILRKTNLDELPQFINVLKGDMSIVGPRPHPTPLNMESKKNVKKYLVRHLVKPGITGWAQVNGYRGETKELIKMQKRVEHDLWYIDNWSFGLDIQIVFLTVWKMMKGDPHAY